MNIKFTLEKIQLVLLVLGVAVFFLYPQTITAQTGCNNLVITGSTSGSVCGKGVVPLEVTASGTGDAIYWYDAATGGKLVWMGNTFTSPEISSTTSYWATEVITTGPAGSVGPKDPANLGTPSSNSGTVITTFKVVKQTILKSVDVYPVSSGKKASIVIKDSSGNTVKEVFYTTLVSGGTSPQTISFFVSLSPGTYEISQGIITGLYMNYSGASFPYTSSSINILNHSFYYNYYPNQYYYFYNWQFSSETVVCESIPRTKLTATVNQQGDKNITALPYSDTEDTANFANNYFGSPGCITMGTYLDGNDVVYHWTAKGDYKVKVDMSNLGAAGSGVFVYKSCADIGINCIAGAFNNTTSNYSFDFFSQTNQDYYIVVGSKTGMLGYTLDLSTQPVNCTVYKITSSSGDTVPCTGRARLSATGSGVPNTKIYWYDKATGGNPIGSGPSFRTPPISATTSYWAAEALFNRVEYPGYGKITTSNGSPSAQANGLVFDVTQSFVLAKVDVYPQNSGTLGIELQDSQGTALQSVTVGVPSGRPAGIPLSIPLNFMISPGTDYRLVKTGFVNLEANPSEGSFPYPLGLNGSFGAITSGIDPSGITMASSYYFFYNWTLIKENIVCESPRVQVKAGISTTGDVVVATPLPYTTTDNTGNYGDPFEGSSGSGCGSVLDYLNGNDVVYYFKADTTEPVDIILSKLTGSHVGVFVYESCADLGTNCIAGAVSGNSSSDFMIDNFQVTAGEDYYIVISSWLKDSVGYTLEIVPFTCSSLQHPIGQANQIFIQPDTVSDLDVQPTEPSAVLTYYDKTADIPANPLPNNTPLADTEDYYITQTFVGCESQPLKVIVEEIQCDDLEITSATDGVVTCRGSAELNVVPGNSGNLVYWYDAATGGDIVGVGTPYQTPVLGATTSYWASEVYLEGNGMSSGYGLTEGSFNFPFEQPNYGLEFTATEPFLLLSVQIYYAYFGGIGFNFEDKVDLVVGLIDVNNPGTPLETASFTLPQKTSVSEYSIPTNLYLAFRVPAAGTYRLVTLNDPYLSLMAEMNSSSPLYPMPIGSVGQITSAVERNSVTNSDYYYFYNWTIVEGNAICESSPRTKVNAIIKQVGNITVKHTDLTPTYTDSDNTGNYTNIFSGHPGSGCQGKDILEGYEVIYHYTGNPSQDEFLDIKLSNISNPDTGMYIYSRCGEVGINCLDGGTNEDNTDILIEDYSLLAGEELFIVISSTTGTTNYTLTINSQDCASLPGPGIADTTPFFITGQTLSDLEELLDSNPASTKFSWYDDLNTKSKPVNPLPGNTPITDGADYYVTGTIQNCETQPLKIVPEEFQCGKMKVSANDLFLCAPGGQANLNAKASAYGSHIFWYDTPTGGKPIHIGDTYKTWVNQTTSFYVAEAYAREHIWTAGKTAPSGKTFGGWHQSINFGLYFDAYKQFVLSTVDVYPEQFMPGNFAGIYLLDSSYNIMDIAIVSLPAADGTVPVTVPLNFIVPAGTGYSLVLVHSSLINFTYDRAPNFPYPIGEDLGKITSTSMILGSNFGIPSYIFYRNFYNWKVIEYEEFCESTPRTKVRVTINDKATQAPTGKVTQSFCIGATLSDVVVKGKEILWYEASLGGLPLNPEAILRDGDVFYASQTVKGCESSHRLMVTINIKPTASLPTGSVSQTFYPGESISDLEVKGTKLTWYEKDDKTQKITDPDNFILENLETYYVSQTPDNFCESGLLAITVYELMGVEDPVFRSLVYYPNPVRHELTIRHELSIESVTLFSILGKKVMEKHVGKNKVILNTSMLQAGIYLLKVEIEGKAGVFKIVKE